MANFGEKSLELIRESVRARDMLGPFNEEKVRLVLEEIKVLMEDVSGITLMSTFLKLKKKPHVAEFSRYVVRQSQSTCYNVKA